MKNYPKKKYIVQKCLGGWNWLVVSPRYSDLTKNYFYGNTEAAFNSRRDARLFAKIKNDYYKLWNR